MLFLFFQMIFINFLKFINFWDKTIYFWWEFLSWCNVLLSIGFTFFKQGLKIYSWECLWLKRFMSWFYYWFFFWKKYTTFHRPNYSSYVVKFVWFYSWPFIRFICWYVFYLYTGATPYMYSFIYLLFVSYFFHFIFILKLFELLYFLL